MEKVRAKIFGLNKSEIISRAERAGLEAVEINRKYLDATVVFSNKSLLEKETADKSFAGADENISEEENLIKAKVTAAFPECYSFNNATLQAVAAAKLKQRGLTLSVAESLTGGLVAAKLIETAGISQNFHEGVVAYSNLSKYERLGVKESTVAEYGAVSAETAAEMAKGIIVGADIAVSTTGIAGPTGESAGKPVGLTYFGVAFGDNVTAYKRIFEGDREEIRQQAANFALYCLINTLNGGF